MKPCGSCGRAIERVVKTCSFCGAEQVRGLEVRPRLESSAQENPTWGQALVLGGLLGGVGFYFGNVPIGICCFLLGIVLSALPG